MNLVGEGPLLSDKDFFNPKEKRELELRGLWDEEELKSQQDLATTFRNQRHQVTPKSRRTRQDNKKVLMEMHGVRLEREAESLTEERPDLFPPELWRLVRGNQKKYVAGRFKKYKDPVYLTECVDKILNLLNIGGSKDMHTLEKWGLEGEASEEMIMRAQALANIDVYFFTEKDTADLAFGVIAEIHTTDEKPMRSRPRKLSVIQQAFLEAKTNQIIKVGKLEESNSQWCHGLVLVAYEERIKAFMDKQGETAMTDMFLKEHEDEVATFFRLCIDLRMLNAKTIPDIFPLPRIDDLIESIPRKCGRYSISDICDAFFTCELKEEHRHKTAFRTHNKHLQFAVLPQGFCSSPSIFSRMIARTFEDMEREKFSAYIDDVLNHTDDFEEHIEVQQRVYDRLRRSKLTVKVTKTHLNQESVRFLGHILTKDGRLPDPKSVEAIAESGRIHLPLKK